MVTLFRNRPTRGSTCQQCQVIRAFMGCAFMLVVLALVATEKLHYLKYVSADYIAWAMMAGGVMMFIVKYVLWRKELRLQANSQTIDKSQIS